MTTGLIVLGAILVLVIVVLLMGGAKGEVRREDTKTMAFVELRSGVLHAFDMPSESGRYEIPDFVPGLYRIPLGAIRDATDEDHNERPALVIDVDTATIYFVDADFSDKLREIDERLFEETNSCASTVERQDAVIEELGIRFDYLEGGSGTGFDFVGDGSYVLDVSQIERGDQPESP